MHAVTTVAPEQQGMSAERLARLTRRLEHYVSEHKIAGILAAILRRGQLVYWQRFGMADIEAGAPVRDDTLFRIYSMTKPITSVALMMLYEQGRFHLGDPVSHFIPAFAKTRVLRNSSGADGELEDLDRAITFADLLTHTAGLSYGFETGDPIDALYQQSILAQRRTDTSMTLETLVGAVAELPLAFQPGTAFRYSLATDVVGYLVQLIADEPFDSYLQRHILAPLGMVDTSFQAPADKLQRFAACYDPGHSGALQLVDAPATSPFTQARFPAGGGGLLSTAPDYLRFCQLLQGNGGVDGVRLLGRKTLELMTLNHLPPGVHAMDDPSRGFGLGFGVVIDVARGQVPGSVGSYGWGGMAGTTFWIDPREELSGLLMLQCIPGGHHPVRQDFQVLTYQALVD